jgi:two-component system NtrC family sensor kinase
MASIGQLAAGVAHEINNPIGFMLSNLNTLKDYSESIMNYFNYATELFGTSGEWNEGEYLNKERLLLAKRKELFIDNAFQDIKPLVQETMEGGERVRTIIQNLRGFARVDETGSKPIDINESLESTLTIAWNELKYKTKIIKEYGAIPKILGNGGEINQVFLNLIINAHQAIKEQGTITIKTWHDDTSIYISIADNGCGIPNEVKNKIFEPFFTTKEVGAGTGLGLSISYDIVKNHGGSIDVWSEKDVGSRFTITLPLMK